MLLAQGWVRGALSLRSDPASGATRYQSAIGDAVANREFLRAVRSPSENSSRWRDLMASSLTPSPCPPGRALTTPRPPDRTGGPGFGEARPDTGRARHVAAYARALNLLQIDSVNVLVRAHYMPLFSRIGAYDRALLDSAAWQRRHKRSRSNIGATRLP